jgi:cytoplasmic iron level regulating protein YaaA (DUF328/UPF0246 family)
MNGSYICVALVVSVLYGFLMVNDLVEQYREWKKGWRKPEEGRLFP